MTDIEHAKKYAEESISLAISMYNPRAEIIARTACLYGLTYKNEQIAELEKENAELKKNYEDSLVACGVLKNKVELLTQPSPLESIQDTLITTQKVAYEKQKEQFIEAKGLLERLLITSCNSDVLNLLPNCSEVLEVRVEAEQFLTKVEK